MAAQDLYSMLQQMTPEEIDTLLQGSLAGDRGQIVQQGMKPFEEMAQTEQPQGQSVGPYHAYVAASPLAHLAAAVRQGMGLYKTGQGLQAQQALVGQKGQGLAEYLQLAARLGQPQPQMQQPVPPQQPKPQQPPMDIPGQGTGGGF